MTAWPLLTQVVAEGHLNAIAFWFDLHLDDQVSITSAPAGFGLGGVAVDLNLNSNQMAVHGRGEVSEDNAAGMPAGDTPCAAASASAVCASASAAVAAADNTAPHTCSSKSVVTVDSQGARMDRPDAGAAGIQGTEAPPAAAGAADGQAACVAHAAAASTAEALAMGSAAACAPHTTHARAAEPPGRQQGPPSQPAPDALAKQAADCSVPAGLGQEHMPGPAPCAGAGAADPAGLRQGADLVHAPCAGARAAGGAGGVAKGHEAAEGEEEEGEQKSSGISEPHYWGQALQYLDCSTPVVPGEPFVLLSSCPHQ